MKEIIIDSVVPAVFGGRDIDSGLWGGRHSFERGKTYLIEAASGTGKSSLCAFIYGYRRDFTGRILFDDTDTERYKTREWQKLRRTSLSLMFQELRLFDELTAIENIRLKNDLTRHKTGREIASLMDALGISDKRDTPARLMSWGQRQRVAFIRALCQPFDFIMMDEPVSHLDECNSDAVASILKEEIDSRGAAAIVTSVGNHLKMDYDGRIVL